MKKILVATDHSAPAVNAVEYAAQIAKITGAELILFSVYKMSIHASNSLASTSTIEVMVKQNEEKLEELSKELADRHQIKVSWELRKTDTIESLKTYMESHIVDLVVMGIESNLTEYKLFGNTTTAAIHLMLFPLLVIPNDIKFEGIGKIMYACESSYLREGCELTVLKDFVKAFNSELEVFHVLTHDEEKEKEEMERVMEKILYDVEHRYRYVSNPRIGEGIQQGLEQFPADLLVMIPHRLGFFETLLKGSQTNQMTVKTRVPLLVIPNNKAC